MSSIETKPNPTVVGAIARIANAKSGTTGIIPNLGANRSIATSRVTKVVKFTDAPTDVMHKRHAVKQPASTQTNRPRPTNVGNGIGKVQKAKLPIIEHNSDTNNVIPDEQEQDTSSQKP